ncbi:MAG: TonB-dependent receptor [Paludibacter sp.]|nr:TonB-dependent receptor [Paludibacter sp.]
MKHSRKKTTNFWCALCMLFLCVNYLYSQTGNVSGTVLDKNNEPLIGASVQVEGTTRGTITNVMGEFSLECTPQDKLKISYIGYITQVIAVNDQKQLTIVLQENAKALEEVVVVGYGVQRKSDLTGSVSSVKVGDAVKTMPVANVTDAIQGRLAGVSIISSSGAPNSSATIRIRGINSFSADVGPLVVIDGFMGGSLNSLNPSDILSIEVLKDASATAVYGSRAANGVILVTTKNPEKGKTKVDYSGYVNLKTPYKLPSMLSPGQFARLANDFRTEMAAVGAPASFPEYTNDELTAFDNGTAGYDYIGNIFNSMALQQVHELSISGGNESTKFLFSGSYNKDEGIVKSSWSDRVNYRLKVDTEVFKWLKAGINIWGDYAKSQGPRFSQYRGVLIESLIYPNTIQPQDADGNYNNKSLIGPQYNPIGHIKEVNRDGYATNSFMQGYVDVTLFKGLVFRMLQGFSFSNSLGLNTNGPKSYAAWQNGVTDAGANTTTGSSWINSNILSYVKEFNENHRINATLVFEQQKFDHFLLKGNGTGLSSEDVGHNNLAFLQQVTASSESSTNTMLSGLARINYVLFNRYMLTASVRRDGSSRLAKQNWWENFTSAAIAWDVKQESFMENINFLDQCKIRLGYGETGNQAVPAYYAYTEYEAKRDADQKLILSQKRLGEPNLRWERSNQFNGGLDLGFFNNRLTATIDVYQKLSKDVLLEIDNPLYTGFPKKFVNSAHILNKGVEVTLGADPYVSKTFSWNTNLTLSNNVTTIEKLADDKKYITLGTTFEDLFYRYILNERVGTIYGYESLGVWKTSELADAPAGTEAGSYKYANLDQSVGNNITAEDQTIIGNGQPTFNWGWTNTFNIKNFDIAVFVIGYHGFDIYNFTAQERLKSLSPDPAWLNRWRPDNENTNIRGFVKTPNFKTSSSQFVEKGDFIKIKSLTAGYSLPQSLLQKLHLSKCRIYVSVQNPILITEYSGIDPEVTLKDPLKPGIDYGYYPNGRNYLMGINVAF